MTTPDILSPSVSSENFTREGVQAAGAEPVAWRVKDFGDGWIIFGTKFAADREASHSGAMVEAIYSASTVEALTAERDAMRKTADANFNMALGLANERDALLSRVERLRGDLQYIAKQWPDSFAAYHARAALREKSHD